MSLTTPSSTMSSYAAASSGGGGCVRALEDLPGKIAAGVEEVGEAVGDVASATVSLSARALQAFEDGGKAVIEGAEDVIAFPFEMAKDAVVGVANLVEDGYHLAEGGYHLLSSGVQAVVSGAASAVHAVVIDLPTALASNMADVTKTAVDDATTIAGAAATVVGGAKVISALL